MNSQLRQSAQTTGEAPAEHARLSGSWGSRRAWAALGVSLLLALVVDLGSKHLAFQHVAQQPVIVERSVVLAVSADDPRMIQSLIPRHQPVRVVPELLDFTLVLNPGAVFGLGPGQRWFFIGFTVVALAFGLAMFGRATGPGDRWAHVGIGLLVGGGLGNLYDRLVYACVRDFLHPLPGWSWPFGWELLGRREIWPYVSNLADLFLLIGIGMLLAHLWRTERRGVVSGPAPAASR